MLLNIHSPLRSEDVALQQNREYMSAIRSSSSCRKNIPSLGGNVIRILDEFRQSCHKPHSLDAATLNESSDIPWCGGISIAKLCNSSTLASCCTVNMSTTVVSGGNLSERNGPFDEFVGSLEDSELILPIAL